MLGLAEMSRMRMRLTKSAGGGSGGGGCVLVVVVFLILAVAVAGMKHAISLNPKAHKLSAARRVSSRSRRGSRSTAALALAPACPHNSCEPHTIVMKLECPCFCTVRPGCLFRTIRRASAGFADDRKTSKSRKTDSPSKRFRAWAPYTLNLEPQNP